MSKDHSAVDPDALAYQILNLRSEAQSRMLEVLSAEGPEARKQAEQRLQRVKEQLAELECRLKVLRGEVDPDTDCSQAA